ncbi:homogentisate 1,2-dioxygenase [Nonlabens sp. MB-3u-79]|jgi:homogentisate 1,2-dioxygenase|uniref:homogentisate 1,2-dioxygenase n=1 Tax=Nonlabens sp. MB-3u-79 TaxID=2058134 RepID=UPI000C2FF6F6|nr:homogentisate 1,2-dioxygenase [Nonlabens sp. MB-3u-79]AUC78385.1 homogentisate 1,2-dioxygenase [Nonlabens sp. MB-3u-79]|tara:strand:+ start:17280 stop:18437 length:1158 start_codon:yes stop_codon:yes gene_type:complete
MPFYHKLGKIPPKRHTQFRKPDGSLYSEQLFGTIGFEGMSTNSYHMYRPTMVKEIKNQYSVKPEIALKNHLKSYRLKGFQIQPEADYLESRKTVLINSDVAIILAAPQESTENYFYKNSDADELLFVHRGTGTLRTHLGNLDFKYGDYLLIPRGIIYKIDFDTTDNRLFIVESRRPIYTPKRYRNWFGQLLEHAPYCERDLRRPETLETHDEKGEFLIKVKKQDDIFDMVYASHPFDVVGYDGYNFPYAFSIHDFEPITGRIHQPPPVHQTFETDAFVVCSFVPRLYDYHPNSIPAPYNHSNIDSDEVLYYVDGDFMSRNDIAAGHISLHPAGIPHGPHPGTVEKSIGKTKTEELAVMVDTFKPLMVTKEGLEIADDSYHKSWLD